MDRRNFIMNRNIQHSQIIFICFLLVGCHNNAHLRTQKVLKPGEKVYSGSGVLAMGGAEEDWDRISNTGVMGFRGEVSMLKGGKDSEAGPYFGVGIGDDGPGLILGYDYRKYTGQSSGLAKKLGAQIEVNFGEAGQTFHLRPSITSTTGRGKPFYGGVHGLLAVGNLMDNNSFEWETVDSSEVYENDWGNIYYERDSHNFEKEIDYRFNSLGAGLTAGAEFLAFDNNSIQLQVDVSLVKNSFNLDGEAAEPPDIDMENVTWTSWNRDDWEENWESHDDELMPMVTGSIGMSFFKPDPTNKESFEPLPTPNYNTGQTQPVFDPETGEKISGGMRFDPETGETIIEMQFDPETGEQLAAAEEKQKMSYDEIVFQAKNSANSRHNRATYNAAGVASCFIYPVGLPVAILYTESGIASNMNPYDPVYLDLDSSQKIQYKQAYKQEEKQLRRKSIYGAEGVCVGAFFFFLMTVDGM
jgi:hypothetical protein